MFRETQPQHQFQYGLDTSAIGIGFADAAQYTLATGGHSVSRNWEEAVNDSERLLIEQKCTRLIYEDAAFDLLGTLIVAFRDRSVK